MPVHVAKPFLPPMEEYTEAIRPLWQSYQLTNNGPLVQELEAKLSEYLGVENLVYCTNGTIALQMALEALSVKEEVITTPFTYVATLDSILWQKCKPVFADIQPDDLCIDPVDLEKKITKNTRAILATHIFGRPCSIEKINKIAEGRNIPVIYDGAHSFGCSYKERSLLSYGNISTCSFNATKIFHTVEGGCVITSDKALADKIRAMRYFGIDNNKILYAGINAKQSEFHAAMGIVNLRYIDVVREKYRHNYDLYYAMLKNAELILPSCKDNTVYNYAYFPVIFASEEKLISAQTKLNAQNIFPKRYFYPSLNTLDFVNGQQCPVAEEIAGRILCLPMYYDLSEIIITDICEILLSA